MKPKLEAGVRVCARAACAALALVVTACAPARAPSAERARPAPALPVPPFCLDGDWLWSTDGSSLLAVCPQGLEVRDGSTGLVRAQRTLTVSRYVNAINRDGSLVALPVPGGIAIRNGRDLSLRQLIVLDGASPAEPMLTFSHDGKRLAAFLVPNLLVELSAIDGKVLWRMDGFKPPGQMAMRLRYVQDAIHLSIDNAPGLVFSHGRIVHPRWARQAGTLQVNRSGTELIFFPGYDTTTVWDIAGDRPLSTHKRDFNGSERWLGEYLAVDAWGGLDLTAPDARSQILHVPHARLLDAGVSADGQHVRSVEEGELTDWTLPRMSARRLAWRAQPRRAMFPGGLVLETEPSLLTLRRAADQSVVAQMRLVGAPRSLRSTSVSPRGELVVIESPDERTTWLRIAGNGPERRAELPSANWQVVVDPLRPRIALAAGGSIVVLDTGSLQGLARLQDAADRQQLEFRSAQDQLVMLHGGGKLTFLELPSGRVALESDFPNSSGQLSVAPDGEHIALGGYGVWHIWSSTGLQEVADRDLRALAFTADSRALWLLSKDKLICSELGTHRTRSEESLPELAARPELVGDWLVSSAAGAEAARPAARGPWQALAAPQLTGLRLLGFGAGALLAFDRGGSFLKWPVATLHTSDPIRVRVSYDPVLSPDGSLLTVLQGLGYGVTFELRQKQELRTGGPQTWSLDGKASIQNGVIVASDAAAAQVAVPGALAFAGNAQSVLAGRDGALLLVDTAAAGAPRTLLTHARLAAQSRNQLTIAAVSERDRRLALLRAPAWQALGEPLAVNGACQVALSESGEMLALLDENNQLEVRAVSEHGVSEARARIALPPAPGVGRMLFSPDARFLFLEGVPLRILRLSDGQLLNMYAGRIDHGDRLEEPLLFVSELGLMEGDARLARELYCNSAAEPEPGASGRQEPCRLPSVDAGLVQRFFAR